MEHAASLESSSDGSELDSTGLIVALLSAIAIVTLYVLTLAPGLGWHDSAELSLRAYQLGATHSPGSPLHTFVGHGFILLTDSPAFATNLLSAISMGLAAGLLALLIRLTRGGWGYAGAFLFACSYEVWTNAVVTELYGPSTLLTLLSSVCLWIWRSGGRTTWLLAGVFAYCCALGIWFANLLFLPAILWLLWMRSQSRLRDGALVFALVALALTCIAAANLWLSLRVPPFGPDIPESLTGLYRYMSGAMHEPLAARDLAFYSGRIVEHLLIFSQNFLWVGIPLGLVGLVGYTRAEPAFGGYLLLLFGIQMTYFTCFGSGDYYSMVMLSYAVFSFWIVCGAKILANRQPNGTLMAAGLLAAILIVQLWQQLPGRWRAANYSPAQEFVDNSFAVLPENALLVAGFQQFAALQYGQIVQGGRPDVEIILPAGTLRHYGRTKVQNYLDHIAANLCERPVFTHKLTDELQANYTLLAVAETEGWFKLESRESGNSCSGQATNASGG
jgi:hypothetical protein